LLRHGRDTLELRRDRECRLWPARLARASLQSMEMATRENEAGIPRPLLEFRERSLGMRGHQLEQLRRDLVRALRPTLGGHHRGDPAPLHPPAQARDGVAVAAQRLREVVLARGPRACQQRDRGVLGGLVAAREAGDCGAAQEDDALTIAADEAQPMADGDPWLWSELDECRLAVGEGFFHTSILPHMHHK
jgi:hypothetical protein